MSLHGVPFMVVVIPWTRVIDFTTSRKIHGITTTVNGTPFNDLERSNERFVAPHKRDVIAVDRKLKGCTRNLTQDNFTHYFLIDGFRLLTCIQELKNLIVSVNLYWEAMCMHPATATIGRLMCVIDVYHTVINHIAIICIYTRSKNVSY